MKKALKVIMHVALFLVALVVFYIGLFVGLQVNPNAGSVLWLVAAAIGLGNLVWIIISIAKTKQQTAG